MRSYLFYIPDRSELNMVQSVVAFLLKKRGETQLPAAIQKHEQLISYLKKDLELKLAVCDVTAPGVLPVLEQLRSGHPDMRLVLLADQTVSPVSYIRPTILPTALLWRPVQPDGIRDALWEVINGIPKDDSDPQEPEEGVFSLESRGVVKRIPHREILFFEAKNKKVYLHHGRKEIPFSGTLEKLQEELPEEFIRVHTSFIVNRAHIAELQYGQNLVLIEGGMAVPISRSYKSTLKAVFS